jgi:hypothetical protein
MSLFVASSTPDKYMELFAWLIVRPEKLENLSKQDFKIATEPLSAWQYNIRSSAKLI